MKLVFQLSIQLWVVLLTPRPSPIPGLKPESHYGTLQVIFGGLDQLDLYTWDDPKSLSTWLGCLLFLPVRRGFPLTGWECRERALLGLVQDQLGLKPSGDIYLEQLKG